MSCGRMGVSGDASRPGRRRSHTPVHPALPPCLLPVHPLYLPVPLQFSGMISQSQIDLGVVSRYFTFQVGANSGQTVIVSASDLGVATGAITGVMFNSGAASALITSANAENSASLIALDAALSAVNSSRATLGAIQSRFSQTITYLQTAVENQTAARGRIMDADFAAETANMSRAQILQQAGTAMIAQANQMPQGVLQLLK